VAGLLALLAALARLLLLLAGLLLRILSALLSAALAGLLLLLAGLLLRILALLAALILHSGTPRFPLGKRITGEHGVRFPTHFYLKVKCNPADVIELRRRRSSFRGGFTFVSAR